MKETVCQYLLVSQINYTLTNFADHCDVFSHDAVNRYLRGERITPRLVWDDVLGTNRAGRLGLSSTVNMLDSCTGPLLQTDGGNGSTTCRT